METYLEMCYSKGQMSGKWEKQWSICPAVNGIICICPWYIEKLESVQLCHKWQSSTQLAQKNEMLRGKLRKYEHQYEMKFDYISRESLDPNSEKIEWFYKGDNFINGIAFVVSLFVF